MKVAVLFALVAAATASPIEIRAVKTIKKGAAYNDPNAAGTLAGHAGVSWGYNWGSRSDSTAITQYPMIWSPGTSNAAAALSMAQARKSGFVLSYNEPDEISANGGCQQTPQQAYAAWGRDHDRFKSAGIKVVCPAVTSWETNAGHTGGPAGLTWLRQFVGKFRSPSDINCDSQALHWYGSEGKSGAAQAQDFIGYIQHAHTEVDQIFKRTNTPLWITEFSPLPVNNPTVMADFLRVASPWLEKTDYVRRYSVFKAEYLVSGSNLNAAGTVYANNK